MGRGEELWWRLYYWWPLPALESAVLLVGALLLAQALNLAWERRELIGLMSPDERRSGALLLAVWALLSVLWGTGEVGIPGMVLFDGAFGRWFVGEVVRLGDEGRIGASWDNEDDEDNDY